MEGYWHAPDGQPIRLITWPAPDGGAVRGSLLFFPGRGDCYEKYLETLEHWRGQGWQVTAMDWRGQAFSGRLGADPVTGHIDDFAQWTADLAAFWPQWAAANSAPRVLAGHSMGGHLVLRAAAEGALEPAPAALVLSAPMLGTHPEWLPNWLQRLAARLMCLLGDRRRPAWKWSEKPGELPADRQELLTHDDRRYADEVFWRDARPELAMGPGSWGWVEAAARSMQLLARPATLARVKVPVFLLATSADRLVSIRAIRHAARLLPDVTCLELGAEAAHEILREVDPVRGRALAAIDAFLDRRTGTKATLDIGREGLHGPPPARGNRVTERFDIAVIGAGMAGASIAAELAPHARVLIAEGERQPGYHTTGRSAAFWEQCYGGPRVVPLTLASGTWLREQGFMQPRGGLYVAQDKQLVELDAFEQTFAGTGVAIHRVGRAEMERLVPGLRPGWNHAISEPDCADIDVAGLHQHYLAAARRAGAQIRTAYRLQRAGTRWRLDFANGEVVEADVVVNAAGAWADEVAGMAGAAPLGITPYRRTIAQVRTDPPAPATLPLVLGIDGSFYFKPEAGRLWLSPHDETPSPACDVAPEELDVALAIDRFEQVVDWRIAALERKWAGLRSFAPDRLPVIGWDARCAGFFWFAGQGGFGIQTAPAAARLGAQVLLGAASDAMTAPIDPAVYSPQRFG